MHARSVLFGFRHRPLNGKGEVFACPHPDVELSESSITIRNGAMRNAHQLGTEIPQQLNIEHTDQMGGLKICPLTGRSPAIDAPRGAHRQIVGRQLHVDTT